VKSAAEPRRYCTFYLGDECFALDISAVREINRRVAITAVRGAPPAVRGLLNLRGQIATVIDPAVRLGQAPRELGASTRLIVLKTPDELIGLCVDRIADVIAIADHEIEPVPGGEAVGGEVLITGVAQSNGESVRILSAEQIAAVRSPA
jgi:purine-binding chemotaxis protein CheW